MKKTTDNRILHGREYKYDGAHGAIVYAKNVKTGRILQMKYNVWLDLPTVEKPQLS